MFLQNHKKIKKTQLLWIATVKVSLRTGKTNKWRVIVTPYKKVYIHVHAFEFIFIIFILNPEDGPYGLKNVALYI